MATDAELRPRPLRRDARENRERILVAAQAVFADAGLKAGVDQIAARAGVGPGTLYRHFSSKDELISAVFEQRLDEVARFAEEALAADDPWEGFSRLIERLIALQHADRGFKDVMAERLGDERRAAAARARIGPGIERLLRRAQDAGRLRPDVVYEDVSMLIWATGEIVSITRDAAPGVWRRYVGLMLDALRVPAEGTPPLGHPPLTHAQHRRAVAQWARSRRGAG
jgi:AcrR family transcriptional regulator